MDDDSPDMNPTGRQFLEAIDKHTLVIAASEFKGMDPSKKSLNFCLRGHFPKVLGLRTRQTGKKFQYLEINFRSNEDLEEALNKKFVLFDKPIRVDRTLQSDTTVIRVGISNIPFESEEILKPRMIRIFKKYGAILEIGIHHVIDGGWFTGKGFATLAIKKDEKFKKLSPQIQSWGNEVNLKLVYSNMPSICSPCHEENHVRLNCPSVQKKKKDCHQCGSHDHLRAERSLSTLESKE